MSQGRYYSIPDAFFSVASQGMVITGEGLDRRLTDGRCTRTLITREKRHGIVANQEVKPNDRESQ